MWWGAGRQLLDVYYAPRGAPEPGAYGGVRCKQAEGETTVSDPGK
jgi:hypothetical protein